MCSALRLLERTLLALLVVVGLPRFAHADFIDLVSQSYRIRASGRSNAADGRRCRTPTASRSCDHSGLTRCGSRTSCSIAPRKGRVLKGLTIVDDATTEAVATVPTRALGGLAVTRILNRLAIDRGLPTALRTDNGSEFCSPPC